MAEEFRSYTDDALADLKASQKRQEKLDDEKRNADALERDRAYRLKQDIINNVVGAFRIVGVTALILAIFGGAVFGLYKAGSAHYAKEGRIDAAWNASCSGANGTLVFGDTDSDQDNRCVFPNGLTEYQYYQVSSTDGHGNAYSNNIVDHNQWNDMCVGAKGLTTPTNGFQFSYCVFPNGFSVSNYEKK